MKFRTLLTDPHKPTAKPVQAFHPTQTAARAWAVEALNGASPEAYVTLYLEVEVEVYQWRKPKPPAPAPAPAPVVDTTTLEAS